MRIAQSKRTEKMTPTRNNTKPIIRHMLTNIHCNHAHFVRRQIIIQTERSNVVRWRRYNEQSRSGMTNTHSKDTGHAGTSEHQWKVDSLHVRAASCQATFITHIRQYTLIGGTGTCVGVHIYPPTYGNYHGNRTCMQTIRRETRDVRSKTTLCTHIMGLSTHINRWAGQRCTIWRYTVKVCGRDAMFLVPSIRQHTQAIESATVQQKRHYRAQYVMYHTCTHLRSNGLQCARARCDV